ncbi:MAG: AEC family transporter [Pseudomonadota bacterium]|nr:AEC family transporter [Pseudomonadota bacterium]
MLTIALSTLPVVLLIALGTILKRLPLLTEPGWQAIDRIVYWVLFPALLFRAVATADFGSTDLKPVMAALVGTVLATSLLVVVLRRLWGTDGPGLASLVMGATRFNTFLGVAVAERLHGASGVALTALCIAVLVPVVNVVSVLALAIWGNAGGRAGIAGFVRQVLTNPLILACLAGAAVRWTGVEVPGPLMGAIGIAGQASLALGLLAIGAGLDFAALGASLRPLLAGTVLKLAVQPAIGFALLTAAGVSGLPFAIALFWLALPAAPSSYVMARTMGGDARLMAGLLTAQLLVGLLTLPVVLEYFAS